MMHSPKIAVVAFGFFVTITSSIGAQQRVFVTSQTTNGNMGGLYGADTLCEQLADGAALGGAWVAWLSDSTTDARDRVTGNGPFVRIDGVQIAADRTDLLDGTLDAPIGLVRILAHPNEIIETLRPWTS